MKYSFKAEVYKGRVKKATLDESIKDNPLHWYNIELDGMNYACSGSYDSNDYIHINNYFDEKHDIWTTMKKTYHADETTIIFDKPLSISKGDSVAKVHILCTEKFGFLENTITADVSYWNDLMFVNLWNRGKPKSIERLERLTEVIKTIANKSLVS